MARLLVPAGVSLGAAQRRLRPGYTQPTPLNDGVNAASSIPGQATVTLGASAGTKGAWTQIVAATVSPISLVHVGNTSLAADTVASGAMLDIGIGGAGSEVVIVPDLAVGWNLTTAANRLPRFSIPVDIPLGSRVAVRIAPTSASLAGATSIVQLVFGQLPNLRRAPKAVVAMGVVSAHGTALGTAAANTKGAWTEIIAATAQPFAALAVGIDGVTDTTLTSANLLLDIGYGASGSEVILAADLPVVENNTEHLGWLGIPPPLIPCRLPAGTRLAARYQAGGVGGSLGVTLYGIPE